VLSRALGVLGRLLHRFVLRLFVSDLDHAPESGGSVDAGATRSEPSRFLTRS
jgi:hypothetical protein